MNKDNKKLVNRLLIFVISLSIILLASILFNKLNNPQSGNPGNSDSLPLDQDIRIDISSGPSVYIGEPFEFKISVLYRPASVSPDFRQLVRDVRFVPFEQRHKSRTSIIENKDNQSVFEYTLSFLIVGIDVVPGNSYIFDEITLMYTDLATSNIETLSIQPSPILIDRYYDSDPLDTPLQSLKGPVNDNATVVFSLLIFCIVLFSILATVLIIMAVRKQKIIPQSIADQIRSKFKTVKESVHDRRRKLIEYEMLVLSLFKSYGNKSAMGFWSSSVTEENTIWSRSGLAIKPSLESAYRLSEPEEPAIEHVESSFEQVCVDIEQQAKNERLAIELEFHGTVGQRIKKNRFTLIAGAMATIIGMTFLYLSINQDFWMNQDAKVFNLWIASLPERLTEAEQQHDLNNLDIEMLGHISDQHRVLENLQSDQLRSAYLYNYGTVATKIYKSILLMPQQDEEEEALEPPTFEFPLLLMANAARYYPDDTDVRRNLEIIVGLKESQKKEESGEIEGELGPPTPGFSRDMNPLLF